MKVYAVDQDTPKWQFNIDSIQPIPEFGTDNSDLPRLVTIEVLHRGLPVLIADGPLKLRLENGAFEALEEMMKDANRPAPPRTPH